MKKMVRIKELEEYCEANKPNSIIFQTDNQDWYRMSDPCKIRMRFPVMMIHENPNVICLKDHQNTLCIDHVRSVEIDTQRSILGTVLTVFCGKIGSKRHDITYTLVLT